MTNQICIAITSLLAVFLSQCKSLRYRRWACIFGMIGQPFWFYTTFVHQQWGIFIMTFFYTAAWARGVWIYWLSKANDWPEKLYQE